MSDGLEVQINIQGLLKLRDQIEWIEMGLDEFLPQFLLRMGLRALAKTKKRTPVKTGYLRHNWTLGNESKVVGMRTSRVRKGTGVYDANWKQKYTSEKKRRAFSVDGLYSAATLESVTREGNTLRITLYNAAEYASYVEHGHMTPSRTNWVNGRFMCAVSLKEIEREIPVRWEREFGAWVKTPGR